MRSRRHESTERAGLSGVIARHPRESVGLFMGAIATLAIFVNALFLQHGPHPAPIFATRPFIDKVKSAAVAPPLQPAMAQPQAMPAPVAAPSPARSEAQVVMDIQNALKQRGYYDGALDGIWGAKTDAAARDFVQAAGLKIDVTPGEGLLKALSTASAKPAAAPAVPQQAPGDPIAAVLAPSKRVLAIQRALSDFGYGQIKPTGVYDEDTRTAIEKFERDRRLPVDGRISEDFVRDLAAMTGRPLE